MRMCFDLAWRGVGVYAEETRRMYCGLFGGDDIALNGHSRGQECGKYENN